MDSPGEGRKKSLKLEGVWKKRGEEPSCYFAVHEDSSNGNVPGPRGIRMFVAPKTLWLCFPAYMVPIRHLSLELGGGEGGEELWSILDPGVSLALSLVVVTNENSKYSKASTSVCLTSITHV